uniref:phosphoethanolamine transferase domain-containing protein n=1 Tax=Rhodanobacter glycinis TaxID=582702 RepID=UPI00155AAB52|nr:phosphoethanolamine transferase domain-containing protein [Rhodanobacter glycinis]
MTTLLALLMLPNLVWLWHDHSLPVWVEAIIMPAILLLVFFAIFGKVAWLGCLLLAPLVLLAPMETYFIALYHHPTSSEAIATAVATNPAEIREYFGHAVWPMGLIFLLTFAFALWTAWLCYRHKSCMPKRLRAWVLTLAIATPLASAGVAIATGHGKLAKRAGNVMTVGSLLGRTVALGYPFGVFPRIAKYRSEWIAMRADAQRLMSYRFGATRDTRIEKRQVYVLVIGESSRRSHWQLFGYQRATTPSWSTHSTSCRSRA